MKEKINITTIGGGKGSYAMLSSLRNNIKYNLSAIISMSDSGGSTGVLREEFDILPPGDVRRAIMALSSEHDYAKQLFDYRFPEGSSVGGHSLGNLLIAAMTDITGGFDKGIKQISKLFRVKGRVIPVTLENHNLAVELEDGSKVVSETEIDLSLSEKSSPIKNAFLEPRVKANEKAIKAIDKSDLIILNFGDLYTSLVPNLLVDGIAKAIKKNKKAKVIYFCNLMTKGGETTDFELIDFVDTVEKYLGKNILDYVIINNGYISDEMAKKYRSLEKKKPVKFHEHDKKLFLNKSYKTWERDLLHENMFIRHSFDKIALTVEEILAD